MFDPLMIAGAYLTPEVVAYAGAMWKLDQLHELGMLSHDEYAAEKAALLASIPPRESGGGG